MTGKKEAETAFTGCCEGPDFKFPKGKLEEMSLMMQKFCREAGSFDCSAMIEKFRGEDGSIDCSKMMKVMGKMFGSKQEEQDAD
jgi:hypothetical protein